MIFFTSQLKNSKQQQISGNLMILSRTVTMTVTVTVTVILTVMKQIQWTFWKEKNFNK